MAIATISIAASAAFGGTTQANNFVSESAPTVPAQGAEWWDSSAGRTFIWFDDGSSAQWVEKD